MSDIPVRKMDFKFDEAKIEKFWYKGNPWTTSFVNALSAVFPDGERFFIDTVRDHKKYAKTPAMKKAVSSFIGQEGHHGKEHENFNKLMEKKFDVPMSIVAKRTKYFLGANRKLLPKQYSLAITLALEHFTAIFADWLLKNPEFATDLNGAHGEMFLWHAVEETEHKAVAFDLYKAAYDDDAVRRLMMIYTTAFFLSQHVMNSLWFVSREGEFFDWKSFIGLQKFLFAKNGMFYGVAPDWLDYFKRGFHPWDHDNRHLIEPYIREYASKVVPTR